MAYVSVDELKAAVSGIDCGPQGTPAELTKDQLEASIAAAQAIVDGYVKARFEDDAVPELVRSLTRNLACYDATLTYRKGVDVSSTDPAYLRYQEAMDLLKAIAAGDVDVTPTPPTPDDDDGDEQIGRVVNTVPAMFDRDDVGIELDRRGKARAAIDWWGPRW